MATGLDLYYNVISDLVAQAGALIAKRNNSRTEFVCKKGDIDLVTETDKEVEKLIMDGIFQKFPGHKFIGEEETSSGNVPIKLTDDPTLKPYPVNGTMSFVHSFPHSCVSVGYV